METSRTPSWSLLRVSEGPLETIWGFQKVSEGPEEAIRRSWDHQRVSEGPEETIRRCQKLLQVLISHQDWMESFVVSRCWKKRRRHSQTFCRLFFLLFQSRGGAASVHRRLPGCHSMSRRHSVSLPLQPSVAANAKDHFLSCQDQSVLCVRAWPPGGLHPSCLTVVSFSSRRASWEI